MSFNNLHILAVSPNSDTCLALKKQVGGSLIVGKLQVVNQLADAQEYFNKNKPNLLIVDLTGQEEDATLFIETINYKLSTNSKVVVFGIHSELNPAVIIKAVSSGVKEFIQYPGDLAALDKALEKHHQQLQKIELESHHEDEAEEQEAQVISFFSPKGGSGASTVAANLAYELIQLHGAGSTILIDFDQSYCNMSGLVNVKATHSLSDVEYDGSDDYDSDIIEKLIIKHASGIHLLFASKSIMDENDPIPEGLLVQLLQSLKEKYKYILIDLPSRVIDSYHQLAVMESHRLMVVASMDIQTLYRSRQYLELAKQHVEVEKLHLVLNRNDLKGCVGLTPQEIETQFRHPVFYRLPNSWSIVVEAVSVGDFVGKLDPSNSLSKALHQLAVQVSGVVHVEKEPEHAERGVGNLLSIIKRRSKVCPS
jgi:pilus assembly protein CpaE